jgi:orotidine-5'-phosphate decarboxylase
LQAKDRIVLALDVDTEAEALALVEKLHDRVGVFKVGMQLFNSAGPGIVNQITARGGRVFVDLKFHDIPNTVAAAARVMTRLGCYMFNLHASGGREMMRAAAHAVRDEAAKSGMKQPLVLAVTVLTSLSQEQLRSEVHIDRPLTELVTDWAFMAKESGMDGVVASPHEVKAIRERCGSDFIIVTPGVRPLGSDVQDQKRVTTPGQAFQMGSDYLVIGRPITQAPDPAAAAAEIARELEA